MYTVQPDRARTAPARATGWVRWVPALAQAAGEKKPDKLDGGLVLQVRGTTLTDLKREVEPFIKRFESEKQKNPELYGVFKLILDFNPDGDANENDKFNICAQMAEDLAELRTKRQVQSIAFVHGKVGRHTLLPLLACSEIVMSDKDKERAALGKAVPSGETLSVLQESTYKEVAKRYTYPLIVHKLYDRK